MRLSLQCQQLAWLAYGVHGNEISSTDAAMMTAYHLLAAEDDVTVRAIIDNTVVVLECRFKIPTGVIGSCISMSLLWVLRRASDRSVGLSTTNSWPGGAH